MLEPEPGTVVAGSTVRVRLALAGGRVVFRSSGALRPDEGHVHLVLDGRLVSMLSGLEQTVEVAPGPHLLEAEFVAIDHLPFDPRVITSVSFTVR